MSIENTVLKMAKDADQGIASAGKNAVTLRIPDKSLENLDRISARVGTSRTRAAELLVMEAIEAATEALWPSIAVALDPGSRVSHT